MCLLAACVGVNDMSLLFKDRFVIMILSTLETFVIGP